MTFTWRRTFPDTHHDFVAEEAGQHVGRIKRMDGGPQNGTWTWSCTGCQRGHEAEGVRPLNGEAPTRDEAIEALAAAWGRAKTWSERTGLPLVPGGLKRKNRLGGCRAVQGGLMRSREVDGGEARLNPSARSGCQG